MKALALYEDCIQFWQRMGVKREDNLIALASLDVVNSKVEGYQAYNAPYYIQRAKSICAQLRDKKYDPNRGRDGWLTNSGL